MRKKGIKIIGFFFLGILLLTVLSRALNGVLIPKVKVKKVSEQVITHRPTSEGVITYKKQLSMTMQPELFVDSLDVTEGQQVEKDQVLYTLNVAMLNEKIQAIEREIAKLVLQNEQAGSESAVEQEKRARSINRATEAYNEAVSAGDSAIARAVEELNTAQNNLSGIDKTKETYEEEKKQLEAALSEKQRSYEEALENKEKMVNEARRSLEQESDPTATTTTISQTQKDIEEKQQEVEKLKQLLQVDGKIKAALPGMVTAVSIKAGGLTTTEAPLLLADTTAGLRVVLQFQKEDQKYITLGTEVALSKIIESDGQQQSSLENQKIISVMEDSEDPNLLNVMIDIPVEGFQIGETLKAEINVPAKKYEQCVPIEALHIDEGNAYYVYCINTKETVLGTEKTIERVDVELIDKNNQYAAVKGIDSDKQVVTETDKEIAERTTVRINE